MKRSLREVPIHMVIHEDVFKNNQFTRFPSFTFTHKTGVNFYCVNAPIALTTKRRTRDPRR